jgi:hypothetical protein
MPKNEFKFEPIDNTKNFTVVYWLLVILLVMALKAGSVECKCSVEYFCCIVATN